MKILWLTWKDRQNPLAGGAELVNEELAKRLAIDGHEVIFLTGGFAGAELEEVRDGFKIVRLGNKWTVYFKAYQYYKKHLTAWPDLVIDEINTIPFLAKFYTKQKNILLIYQLCREIWFYQMFFPLSLIGYILEPIYLWLLRDRKVITESVSTKKDLLKYGFKAENISIISVGFEWEPIGSLETVPKFDQPTVLALGTVRAMKRTDQVLKAFEILKKDVPEAQLIIAGQAGDTYGANLIHDIRKSPCTNSIRFLGPISNVEKKELLQRAQVLAVTSIKEGWGIVVTEANSQGTPAVVYDADGLRDSVKNGVTGLVCGQNTPESLAENITKLLKNPELYLTLRKNGWEWSKEINFENSYRDFKSIINN